MRSLETLTDEQKKKLENFEIFYQPDLIEIFAKIFDKEKEETKNQEFYQHYMSVVGKTAELLRELGAIDPLTATAVFQYLLWNGYLSNGGSLEYSISGRINNMGASGADILCGKSVCLNNADMQAEVLKALGCEAHIIGANIESNAELNLEYKPEIERNINKKTRLSDRVVSFLVGLTPLRNAGNHAVTLIKPMGQYVISDPTSLAYANFNDFLNTKFVGSEVEMKIKPWLMLMTESNSKEEFSRIVYESFLLSDSELLNPKLVKQVYENGIYLCKKDSTLLKDFHEDIQPSLEKVGQTLKKVKVKIK